MHKRGWINSCHVVKNRGGKENGAAPSDESHPRSRGDTRVELSPETTCQLPAAQEGTARPRRPGELRPTRPGAERWFRLLCTRRPRWPLTGTDFVVRGASEIRRRGREGASDSRKPRAGGGGRRHRAFPRFHPLGRRVRGSESSPGRSRRPSHRVALRWRERWPDASALDLW